MAARSVCARWLLLCALALAVVAMHHVPAGHDPVDSIAMSASATTHADLPMPGHDSGHAPLHECLAVLTAAVIILLLVTALLKYRAIRVAVVRRCTVRRAARPPPAPAGRLLLAAHCVLRI